jgi:hypothetical protein
VKSEEECCTPVDWSGRHGQAQETCPEFFGAKQLHWLKMSSVLSLREAFNAD